MRLPFATLALLIGAIAATGAWRSARAQAESKNIKDNSFLIEEAYNQEAGVAQKRRQQSGIPLQLWDRGADGQRDASVFVHPTRLRTVQQSSRRRATRRGRRVGRHAGQLPLSVVLRGRGRLAPA